MSRPREGARCCAPACAPSRCIRPRAARRVWLVDNCSGDGRSRWSAPSSWVVLVALDHNAGSAREQPRPAPDDGAEGTAAEPRHELHRGRAGPRPGNARLAAGGASSASGFVRPDGTFEPRREAVVPDAPGRARHFLGIARVSQYRAPESPRTGRVPSTRQRRVHVIAARRSTSRAARRGYRMSARISTGATASSAPAGRCSTTGARALST